MKKVAVLLVILFPLLPFCVKAHPGKTNENGGHYDNSTGEYHYHHGYPAHYHYDIDGDGKADCPYNFDDRTGMNSGSSSSSGYYSSNQFSNSYLDGYDEGHEAGYYAGYRAGKTEGYSSGYDAGVSNTETTMTEQKQKAIETERGKAFYACVGVCAGTATIASVSGKKRKKEDAAKIDEVKEELSAKFREISELEDQKERTRETISNLETNLSASSNETERLKLIVEKGINQSIHQKLTEMYGADYINALSGAPSGDYLDENGMPHSKTSRHFRSTDRYVFYLGGTTNKSTKTYHTKFCHHANMNLPINAYNLSKSGSYNRCLQCMPKLPDVSWVERYKVYSSILKDVNTDEADVAPNQDAAAQSDAEAPSSPHM